MKPSEVLKEAAAIRAELQVMLLAEIATPPDTAIQSSWRVVENYAEDSVHLLGAISINGARHEFTYSLPMDCDSAHLSGMFEQFVRDLAIKSGVRDSLAAAIKDSRIFPVKKR